MHITVYVCVANRAAFRYMEVQYTVGGTQQNRGYSEQLNYCYIY
jgi:hypothetical protein